MCGLKESVNKGEREREKEGTMESVVVEAFSHLDCLINSAVKCPRKENGFSFTLIGIAKHGNEIMLRLQGSRPLSSFHPQTFTNIFPSLTRIVYVHTYNPLTYFLSLPAFPRIHYIAYRYEPEFPSTIGSPQILLVHRGACAHSHTQAGHRTYPSSQSN